MARSTCGMKGKENQDLACCSCAWLAGCEDDFKSGKHLSQDHSGADWPTFHLRRKVPCSLIWRSYCALSSLFMKGQSTEQHMACISPSLAAALGTSHAQFLLLHSTAVVLQHIFSSLRYCSCIITVKIEPRNVIIDLYVRYHYEQENKWFSASNSISLTKIVAWVKFLPPSSQR